MTLVNPILTAAPGAIDILGALGTGIADGGGTTVFLVLHQKKIRQLNKPNRILAVDTNVVGITLTLDFLVIVGFTLDFLAAPNLFASFIFSKASLTLRSTIFSIHSLSFSLKISVCMDSVEVEGSTESEVDCEAVGKLTLTTGIEGVGSNVSAGERTAGKTKRMGKLVS